MSETACVYIVDDEEAIRDSLALLLRSVGIPTRLFPDGGSFLAAYHAGMRGCVVLDVRMPRMGGLELQQELNRRGCSLPLIFMSGHGDVPMAVEAMRAGAMDFLQKPFHDEDMIRRVQRAMEQGERDSAALEEREGLRRRFETLTPARARGGGAHRLRRRQQGHRHRPGPERAHGGAAPGPHHAEDGGPRPGPPGADDAPPAGLIPASLPLPHRSGIDLAQCAPGTVASMLAQALVSQPP